MEVVESHHDLNYYIACLIFCEVFDNLKPLEQFATFDDLRDNVVVLTVFEEVDYADYLGVALAAQDCQFVF